MTHLFDPLTLRGVTLRNRIGVSPMCQYSSTDGLANDWHLVHLGARAVGGAGLIIMEDTAVLPEGRITLADNGLWSDDHIAPLGRVTSFLKAHGAVPGIQIGYAGRKGSTTIPWEGGRPQGEGRSLRAEEGAWETLAPSAEAFGGERVAVPRAMTQDDIARVQAAFAQAARRADAAGFDLLELHGGWGYIFQQFYSPVANHRTDGYGGGFAQRARFTVETVRAVRQVWPDRKPLAFRMAATDWIDGGWTPEEAVELARLLKGEGVDLVDVISAAVAPQARVPWGPLFQVPFSERIRREAGVATTAVGFITEASEAQAIVADGKADLVLLARAMLRDPHWPVHAAEALGVGDRITFPNQYEHWLSGRPGSRPLGDRHA
ncbi:NADH:flavin oxidoreductase/NADH oxidase [Methylobacterium oryzisoli]|uniref:NADH:flavin oxidoreductase/NADH oxidase n=1 Tax=Methylobacterium oryzisoli TaxID=3385502 RepID=UPI003892318E